MSQINDALRRAGHNAKAVPAGPPMPPPPMPPPMPASAPPPPPPASLPPLPPLRMAGMDEGEAAPRKSSGMQILLGVALVLCVAIAAVVTFWEKRNRSSANVLPTSEAGAKKILPTESIQRSQAPPRSAPAAPTNVGVPAVAVVPAPARAAAPVAVAAPVTPSRPVEPVKFPPLRLQSIFFRPSSPSVMINNKTLFIDDTIQGVQVADIQPSSVTLVLSGQTNILTLR